MFKVFCCTLPSFFPGLFPLKNMSDQLISLWSNSISIFVLLIHSSHLSHKVLLFLVITVFLNGVDLSILVIFNTQMLKYLLVQLTEFFFGFFSYHFSLGMPSLLLDFLNKAPALGWLLESQGLGVVIDMTPHASWEYWCVSRILTPIPMCGFPHTAK